MEGGLALPDFIRYYWAVNVRVLMFYFHLPTPSPKWLLLEREDCYPYNPGAILLAPSKLPKSKYQGNEVIHASIGIWKQLSKHTNLSSLAPLMPIHGNPSFAPSTLDIAFKIWENAGIMTLLDLYIDGGFASFQQLVDKFRLPKSNFFRYLQIRDYVRKYIPSYETLADSKLRSVVNFSPYISHLVSILYTALQDDRADTSHIKENWEKDLNIQITEEQWNHSLNQIHKCSINVRHCLMQFKMVHRLHFSKAKLNRWFPSVSPLCDKCQTDEATLAHSYILCPKIQVYWCNIFDIISEILDSRIEPDPQTIIFNISEALDDLTSAHRRFVNYCLMSAKKCLLMLWKGKDTPNVKMWLADLVNTLEVERIRYIGRDQVNLFDFIWQPFIQYLERTPNSV